MILFSRAQTGLDGRPGIGVEHHTQLGQGVRIEGAVAAQVTDPGGEIGDRDQVIPEPGHQGCGLKVFNPALTIETWLCGIWFCHLCLSNAPPVQYLMRAGW